MNPRDYLMEHAPGVEPHIPSVVVHHIDDVNLRSGEVIRSVPGRAFVGARIRRSRRRRSCYPLSPDEHGMRNRNSCMPCSPGLDVQIPAETTSWPLMWVYFCADSGCGHLKPITVGSARDKLVGGWVCPLPVPLNKVSIRPLHSVPDPLDEVLTPI